MGKESLKVVESLEEYLYHLSARQIDRTNQTNFRSYSNVMTYYNAYKELLEGRTAPAIRVLMEELCAIEKYILEFGERFNTEEKNVQKMIKN